VEAIKLFDILGDQIVYQIGNFEDHVTRLDIDSRNVVAGSCYAALRGYTTDGHNYISSAIANGARYVLCESIPEQTDDTIGYVIVKGHLAYLLTRTTIFLREKPL
jgi:UDP-N-acetylmuramoyl-L-alanyl-D-glutamate--2,6-diaminopimelate ligase